jgi:ATP-dependent RNA helicase RhlE
VKDIGLVVNFDLPNEPEAYVHRIGRTARAGAEGRAVAFCSYDELEYLRDIERIIRMPVPVWDGHDFHQENLAAEHARGPRGQRLQQAAPSPTRRTTQLGRTSYTGRRPRRRRSIWGA